MNASYFDVIEPIWEKVSIYDGEHVYLKQFRKISERQQNLFAAHWCQSEVCNGGFSQFFQNSTGVLCPEAVEGLKKIGMPRTTDIVKHAMAHFGSEYPRDKQKRRLALYDLNPALKRYDEDPSEELGDLFYAPFDDLDDKFFDLIGVENGGFEAAATRYAFAD